MPNLPQQKPKNTSKEVAAPSRINEKDAIGGNTQEDETHSVTTVTEEPDSDNEVLAPDGTPETKKEPEPLF